jgi:ankyrin repeat protein
LMEAVMFNKEDFVVLLLEQDNINTNIQETSGDTAFTLALLQAPINIDIVEMLLQSTNPNLHPPANTALQRALLNIEAVKLLLEHGVDVNQQNDSGTTALILATAPYFDTEELLKLLLPVKGIDLDAVDDNGTTALMYAVLRGKPEYVQTLLEAGADPLIKGNDGKIASQLFIKNVKVKQMLKDAETTWLANESRAKQDLQQKFMIAQRLRTDQTLPQRQLGEYIIRKSEYDNLCVGLQNNLNKPGVVALARSLRVPTSNKTKNELCRLIADILIKP